MRPLVAGALKNGAGTASSPRFVSNMASYGDEPSPPEDEFKNPRKSRSRRGNEAEVFFAAKSASLRLRLQFLNSPFFLKVASSSSLAGETFFNKTRALRVQSHALNTAKL